MSDESIDFDALLLAIANARLTPGYSGESWGGEALKGDEPVSHDAAFSRVTPIGGDFSDRAMLQSFVNALSPDVAYQLVMLAKKSQETADKLEASDARVASLSSFVTTIKRLNIEEGCTPAQLAAIQKLAGMADAAALNKPPILPVGWLVNGQFTTLEHYAIWASENGQSVVPLTKL